MVSAEKPRRSVEMQLEGSWHSGHAHLKFRFARGLKIASAEEAILFG
jgi:hypothetical protein